MDIQNSLRKLLHEPGREQPHVSGKANEIDGVLLQHGNNLAVVLFARFAFGRNHDRTEPTLARSGDSRRVGLVRDDDGDTRIRNAARINAVGNRDEVRSASGKKYAQIFHFWQTS
jgi:hypothetical protein